MIFGKVFWIAVVGWCILCKICYLHFRKIRHSLLIDNLVINFPEFDKLDVYKQISCVLSMFHALASFFISLYLIIMYNKQDIYASILYHIIIGLSLSHYTTDLLIVGYYNVQHIFVIHHIVSIILIITFYINSQISPEIYPISMVFMEITNPFQIIFVYLSETKQTRKRRFYIISTIFTFMFTYVRTLIMPFIYIYVLNIVHNEIKLEGTHKIICNICGVLGALGGLIWNYNLAKGYYNKIYLPMITYVNEEKID